MPTKSELMRLEDAKRVQELRAALMAGGGSPHSIRLPEKFLKRVDAVVAHFNRYGSGELALVATRSQVLRFSLLVGMNSLESICFAEKSKAPRKKRTRSSKQSKRRKARRGKT